MMKNKITRIDNFAWLPGHGSSGYIYANVDLELHIGILYDQTYKNKSQIRLRRFSFPLPSFFLEEASPGPSLLDSWAPEGTLTFNCLYEVENSPWAKQWSEHWQRANSTFKHYGLSLEADNVLFQIVATGWKLSEPRVLCENHNDKKDKYYSLIEQHGIEYLFLKDCYGQPFE
ncbi:hypothetical protein [Desulfovibrio litoralis]|uniref:Uncharacterized protein n=1 Tax=Desulfovibrio litoralis DSM 11393 TaxID=1121455 RepID=A0A1M7TGW1_9BACT|nr:hypothetical protein [Desulfovibrio litoralis]SHN69982.1 hypothetical protein SAMN02745728_01984 [Desulfovibrio litoralis DSM 11393]